MASLLIAPRYENENRNYTRDLHRYMRFIEIWAYVQYEVIL